MDPRNVLYGWLSDDGTPEGNININGNYAQETEFWVPVSHFTYLSAFQLFMKAPSDLTANMEGFGSGPVLNTPIRISIMDPNNQEVLRVASFGSNEDILFRGPAFNTLRGDKAQENSYLTAAINLEHGIKGLELLANERMSAFIPPVDLSTAVSRMEFYILGWRA